MFTNVDKLHPTKSSMLPLVVDDIVQVNGQDQESKQTPKSGFWKLEFYPDPMTDVLP